jgi:NDP-sugar pyrophosphorylase family protein
MKAVILAGGKGTRLAPYTAILPKPLLPLGDRPILETVLRQLGASGIKDVTLSVGYLGGLIEAYFQTLGPADLNGVALSYAREASALGTAGPLAMIPGLDSEPFLVMNGDVLTDLSYGGLVDFHKAAGGALTIAAHTKEIKIDLGVLETMGARLVDYKEKPIYFFDVSMGVYVYEPRVLGFIARDEYLDFPELVRRLLRAGEKVATFHSESTWFDIGRREDYELALEAVGEKNFDL